jgi:hypothetical protein
MARSANSIFSESVVSSSGWFPVRPRVSGTHVALAPRIAAGAVGVLFEDAAGLTMVLANIDNEKRLCRYKIRLQKSMRFEQT